MTRSRDIPASAAEAAAEPADAPAPDDYDYDEEYDEDVEDDGEEEAVDPNPFGSILSFLSRSRNAIKLLGIMGYDEEVLKKAEETAAHFLETGEWRM